MTSLGRGLLLALAACLAACKGSGYWIDRLDANRLHRRALDSRQSPECARLVPIEFGATFPVPVREGGGRFKVLYYPTNFAPSKCDMASPVFAGEFSLDPLGADRCVSLDTSTVESLGRCVPAGLSMTGYYRTETRLFESLEPAAALFFKGAAPGAQERTQLADYARALQTLVPPAMLPYYYRQSPEFWEWLRQEAGLSIPKPQK